MAQLDPFHAWRYAPAHQASLSRLIAPPYDVISAAHRKRLAAADPHGFVHLILPETAEGDIYRHAAHLMSQWQAEGVLSRDSEPSYTIHRQTYEHPHGGLRTRSGLLGLLPMPAADDHSVLAHESTMEGPRNDRRRLMLATRAQLSPVFLLATDESGRLAALLDKPSQAPVSFTDPEGIQHQVEEVPPGQRQQELQEALADTTLVIADGHHRYESAQACRNDLAGELGAEHPVTQAAGRVLAHVVSMSSPGLSVLAFHRLIPRMAVSTEELLLRLAEAHTLTKVAHQDIDAFMEQLHKAPAGTLGMAVAGSSSLYLVHLAEPAEADNPVHQLEVSLLHRLILDRQLGLDAAAIEAGQVDFLRDAHETVARVRQGQVQAAFLLRPTSMADLLKVTTAGQRMPQKSTNFFPKVPAGLVAHRFDA